MRAAAGPLFLLGRPVCLRPPALGLASSQHVATYTVNVELADSWCKLASEQLQAVGK